MIEVGEGAWKSGYKDSGESNMWELLGGAETARWMEGVGTERRELF